MGRTARALGLILVVGVGLPACAMAPTNLTAGSRCLRSTQCAPGLVCAGGVCTADLDGFGGTVPVIDAGTPDVPPGMDAPLDDVGPLPDVPGEDAPMTMMDSGEMPDVPPTPVDAPVIMPDTPAVMPDAPPDPPDAPPDMPDAPPDEDAP